MTLSPHLISVLVAGPHATNKQKSVSLTCHANSCRPGPYPVPELCTANHLVCQVLRAGCGELDCQAPSELFQGMCLIRHPRTARQTMSNISQPLVSDGKYLSASCFRCNFVCVVDQALHKMYDVLGGLVLLKGPSAMAG